MAIRFRPGDKVQLISGGLEMTIRGQHYDVYRNRYQDDVVDCIWFTKNSTGRQEVHYAPYNESELIKTKDAWY